MTLADLDARIAEVRALDAAVDHEGAHSREDALCRDVLHAIAMGTPDAADLAIRLLVALDHDHPRWCA